MEILSKSISYKEDGFSPVSRILSDVCSTQYNLMSYQSFLKIVSDLQFNFWCLRINMHFFFNSGVHKGSSSVKISSFTLEYLL